MRREVLTAQNCFPHIEQWSSSCASSAKARVLSQRAFARSGSRHSSNWRFQSKSALARDIASSRSRAPGRRATCRTPGVPPRIRPSARTARPARRWRRRGSAARQGAADRRRRAPSRPRAPHVRRPASGRTTAAPHGWSWKTASPPPRPATSGAAPRLCPNCPRPSAQSGNRCSRPTMRPRRLRRFRLSRRARRPAPASTLPSPSRASTPTPRPRPPPIRRHPLRLLQAGHSRNSARLRCSRCSASRRSS